MGYSILFLDLIWFQMIQDVLRKFAQENFSHEYFPVLHGKTDKVQPLALVVRQHRPLWKRPFAKSKIIILARFDGYVEKGAQETVCEAITSNIRDEELSMKQKVDMAARYQKRTLLIKISYHNRRVACKMVLSP